MSEKKFYVYVHRYASGHKEGQVFYVGKGSGRRLNQISDRSEWWKKIVNKYGFTPKIVLRFCNEECAFSFERSLIKFYGRENLCNLTDGGDGLSGYAPTKETREKLSKAKIGSKRKPFSESHKEAISRKAKGRIPSDEARQKMSKAGKGKQKTEKAKENISKGKRKAAKSVVNCEGLYFRSAADAADYVRQKYPKAQSSLIIRSCRHGGISYGYKWRYADETQIQTPAP